MFSLSSKALLLDIETSGLMRKRDQVISIGVTYLDTEGSPTTKHWFLEKKEDEKSLLENFLLFIQDYQTVYSYNGKSFDYPFLLCRMQYYNLDTSNFIQLKLLDTKVVLKHFSPNRKNIEQDLGFVRKSSTDGHDVIKLYRTYTASHEAVYRDLIYKHQEDELHSLMLFIECYRLLFCTSSWELSSQSVTSSHLLLTLKVPTTFSSSFKGTAFDLNLAYCKGEDHFELALPLNTNSLKHYLEPVKDYYYLINEHQIMHKSIAQFMPSDQRRRATKDECALTKSSTFIQIYTNYKCTKPLWHDDEKRIYVEASDFSLELLTTQIFYLFFKNTLNN